MKFTIKFTETAKIDFRKTFEYIAISLGNEVAATRLLNKAEKLAKTLDENPKRQPLVRDRKLAKKGLRHLPVDNYFLFYIVCEKTNTVYIVGFIYSSRNWESLFNEIKLPES